MLFVERAGDAEQVHGLGPEGHRAPHLAHVDRKASRFLCHATAAGGIRPTACSGSADGRSAEGLLVLPPDADRVVPHLFGPAHEPIITSPSDRTPDPS